MMRVMIVGLNYAPEPTGIALYTTSLAEGLATRGVDTTVVTGLPHYPWWRVMGGHHGNARHELNGVEIRRRWHSVPSKASLGPRLLMEILFGVNAVLSRWHRPDVIVTVSPALFASLIVGLKARLLGIPVVVWVQDLYGLGIAETGSGGRLPIKILDWTERTLMRRARRVVAIHDRLRRVIVGRLRVSEGAVRVIRNWSHVEIRPGSARDVTRRRLGWSESAIVVLHAGNMGAKQGLENVVEASRIAADRHEDVLFVLLGNGNQRATLAACGGNRCLQFLDTLPEEEFHDALLAADVLLVNERPGVAEMAVPSKLTSYFATGLPIIAATDQGSITAEEMARSQAGLRVDASSPKQLVDAALELAANRGLANALGQRGLRYRAEHLTEDAAISAFTEILRDLISAEARQTEQPEDHQPNRHEIGVAARQRA
jgi:glycosyltransferase involved in cell wall biosynthesis